MLTGSTVINIIQLIPTVSQSFQTKLFYFNTKSTGLIWQLLNSLNGTPAKNLSTPFLWILVFGSGTRAAESGFGPQ